MIKFDMGHVWVSTENFDVAINYPPFYRRPYAMISVAIKDKHYALWFGKYWLPHIIKPRKRNNK